MGWSEGGVTSQPTYKDIPDELVEEFIASHPEGASCEEIAEVMGMTRTRVGQILKAAIEKCHRVCQRRDIAPADYIKDRSTVWERLAQG
jgi:predicted transcriptional regulator